MKVIKVLFWLFSILSIISGLLAIWDVLGPEREFQGLIAFFAFLFILLPGTIGAFLFSLVLFFKKQINKKMILALIIAVLLFSVVSVLFL